MLLAFGKPLLEEYFDPGEPFGDGVDPVGDGVDPLAVGGDFGPQLGAEFGNVGF